MHLLPKSVIQSQVASQKKAQIDEGLALARKIDVLRETLTNLELKHSQFVAGMGRELEEKTKHLHETVGELERDIVELQERRAELSKPLDAQLEEVRRKEQEIEQIKAVLTRNSLKMSEKEQKITLLMAAEKEKLSKIKVRERELEKAYERAQKLEKEAEDIHSQAVSHKETQDASFALREKEISGKEAENEFNRQANENLKAILTEKEKELNDKERAINDKYQTLMRSIERHGKRI